MSGWGERAIAVSLAAGLVCCVVSQPSSAQDMAPLWPTLEPPTAVVANPTPAAVTRASADTVLPVTPQPAAPAASIPATPQSPAPQTTEARLDQLVAPVALYPDPLLGQVLMASTYPHEIAEAARWVRAASNRALSGDAFTAALKAKGWNPSVMALAPFPSLLAIMADKLDWTGQLGNAFLAQQGEVVAAVQRLRHAALVAGNLKATPECHCIIQTSGAVISIQPSDAQLVSVPVYNPAVAYGNWAEPAYPPATLPLPPGFIVTPGNVVSFNPPIEVTLFGPIWGWGSVDWPNRWIVVDNGRYAVLAPGHAAFAGGVWVHEPSPPHRVANNTPPVATHPGHHAKPLAMRRFVTVHPSAPHPPYWWSPHRHVWALPPGTIVPPPPPPHHAFRDWRDGYFDPYR